MPGINRSSIDQNNLFHIQIKSKWTAGGGGSSGIALTASASATPPVRTPIDTGVNLIKLLCQC
jgi:hypothetical protein